MILLDEVKLNLLLERKKQFIGKNVTWDSILSAVSFLVSVFLASYPDIYGIPGNLLKYVFVTLGLFFTGKSIRDVYHSVKNSYTADDLFQDINKLNKITHPHSIVAIKDSFSKYPNRFLLYFDTRWSCDLFLNFKENINNEQFIREKVSNQLKVAPEDILIEYVSQEMHEKYSVSHKEPRVYFHRLYRVTLKRFPETLKQDTFEIEGTRYRWMSISEMEADRHMMETNSDVVAFVKNHCS